MALLGHKTQRPRVCVAASVLLALPSCDIVVVVLKANAKSLLCLLCALLASPGERHICSDSQSAHAGQGEDGNSAPFAQSGGD